MSYWAIKLGPRSRAGLLFAFLVIILSLCQYSTLFGSGVCEMDNIEVIRYVWRGFNSKNEVGVMWKSLREKLDKAMKL